MVKPDGRVHGLFPTNPEYYIRRGASTFPARVDELKEMMWGELAPSTAANPLGASGTGRIYPNGC